jgi:transposase
LKKRSPHPLAVCFECSTGYGVFYERLCTLASRVEVAHPGQLRLIFRAKKKNDRVDAEKLAKLLFLGEVPKVHVPEADVRGWRALIEYRNSMVQERTRVKSQVRALLRGLGIEAPKSLWSRKGLAWLQELVFAYRFDALRRNLLLRRLQAVIGMLKEVERELNVRARSHAGVVVLMTIPGVGLRTGEAVVAYLDNPQRFARSKQVGSYFGLVPRQDASGGMNRLGHITRDGPATVRRLLTEAAWQGIRRSPTLKAYFERISQGDRDRRKIALTATAHYLVRVMHALLRTGECWQEAA